MSCLIKNATIWQWEGAASPRGSAYRIVSKKWIAVTKEGRFQVPSDTEAGAGAGAEAEAGLGADEDAYDVCIDAAGRLVLPGLIDSHIHVAMTGESVNFADLSGCRSVQQLADTLRTHIQTHPGLAWVIGVNWDQTKLGRYPTRHDIDSVSPGVKVFLWRACWHIGLCNSVALAALGISTEPNHAPSPPPGGVIDYDGSSVTGILRERAVEVIMQTVVLDKTDEEKTMHIRNGLAMCSRLGLTSVQTNDEAALGLYRALAAADQLPIRVFLTPTHTDIFGTPAAPITSIDPFRPAGLARGAETSSSGDLRCAESRLLAERVKIFGDGSLGAETAAMRLASATAAAGAADAADADAEADADVGAEARHRGVLMHRTGALRAMVGLARERGWRLEVHAIGDAAAEQV
jgi:predicted amidohydrolase YtcJ